MRQGAAALVAAAGQLRADKTAYELAPPVKPLRALRHAGNPAPPVQLISVWQLAGRLATTVQPLNAGKPAQDLVSLARNAAHAKPVSADKSAIVKKTVIRKR